MTLGKVHELVRRRKVETGFRSRLQTPPEEIVFGEQERGFTLDDWNVLVLDLPRRQRCAVHNPVLPRRLPERRTRNRAGTRRGCGSGILSAPKARLALPRLPTRRLHRGIRNDV